MGRVDALERLTDALSGGRAVVVVGPPGIGKSRLVAEALHRLSHEAVCVARLAEVGSAQGLVARVADAIGVWQAPAASTSEREARVTKALAARGPGILVLDHFEQLPRAADEMVQRWMLAGALSVLVTSRRRLVCDATHLELGPLEVAAPSGGWAEAATLMRDRAYEIGRTVLDDVERDTVHEIVARLDGTPLAIELAAARLTVLTPAQLLLRLDDRFRVLDGAGRALSAALASSYASLEDRARECLIACSVFRGGVRLEAIEHVLGTEVDALGSLAALRSQSLLQVERTGDVYRYGLSHTVREFVQREAEKSESMRRARAAHAVYFSELAQGKPPGLAVEIDNLRAAFAWAREHHPKLGAQLALALSDPGLGLPYGEANAIVSAMIDHPEAGELPPGLRGELLFRRGTVRRFVAEFDGAIADLERAESIAAELGDDALRADVVAGLGNTLSGQADWAGARAQLERALALHPAPTFRPLALAMIANTFSNEDAHESAEPLLREAIAGADAHDDAYAGAFARVSLGVLLVERSAFDEAFGCLVDALSVLETSRSSRVMQARHLRAVALTHLGRVKQEAGDTEGALADYHEAIHFAEDAGVQRAEAFALYGLASLLLEMGELRAADDRIRAALPLMRETCRDVEGCLVALQGALFALRGAREDAERFFRRSEALLVSHKRPVFSAALAVLRGRDAPDLPFGDFADVRLARRLRARFPDKQAAASLFVDRDATFFRLPGSGDQVSLTRRKAVRGVLRALVEARLARPGVPVPVDALVVAGWPGEKILPAAGAERVYAAIATLRRLGLRGVIEQQADGYLVPPDRAVVLHEGG